MPLNINLQQILLHALNFVILFGALYFLLYRPVKTYMDGRRAHYAKLDEDAKSALAAAKGEISELMSAAAEKLVLSSTSDAYDQFLNTAEERKDHE